MNFSLRKHLFQIGSFVLAGGLLYLALRGVDFGTVANDLREADYRWLVPLIAATVASHWFRGWRWVQILEALPPQAGSGKKVTISGAFGAVMIGYLANYLAPRIGEFVRTANVSTRYGIKFSAVLGTVTVERVLDVFSMALALLTLPFILSDRSDLVVELLVDPLRSLDIPWLPIVVGLVLLAALALWLVRRLLRPGPDGSASKIGGMIASFRDGLLALVRSPRRGVIAFSTVGIWLCYGLMAYIPFRVFGMHDVYNLGLLDGWALMLLGAIGVVIPSPGGIGTYHYITIQSLVLLWNVPQATAASYALLSHTGQLLLYVLIGSLAILVQGIGIRSLSNPEILEQDALGD